ncbi:PKD domain-containing protein [Actinospica durhamensis]|uniref:PKD domain-containing protein n=1 Tax=Actinospica durhamensis TaxID=1508375 RepID=A0A941EIY5_9ACTN|nr:PKD domain-containing protein [Actinospica durhamensis]MBR7832246.1 PKD domain-containing protein [Actinospica durhamensis]
MRTRRTALCAVLVVSTVGMAPAIASADSTSSTIIYVDGSSTACSDSGTGTGAVPFCTLQNGVNAAVAGDTVEVSGSVLYAPVTISNTGTATDPITIEGSITSTTSVGVAAGSADTVPVIAVDGASYVTISGFQITSTLGTAVSVSGSSHVTLDKIRGRAGSAGQTDAAPLVELAASSSAVTVSRSELIVSGPTTAPVIQVDAGASGDVITTNFIQNISSTLATSYAPLISVVGATGTDVVSNTVSTGSACGTAVGVSGASGGSVVENNILTVGGAGDCVTGTPATGMLSVSDSAQAPVTADYNLLWPSANVSGVFYPYAWNGAFYSTAAALASATTEGAHDLVADPQFTAIPSPSANSPAIGSADSSAPGMLSTDYFGNQCTYDAFAAIAGAGSPDYCTRGAVQYQAYSTVLGSMSFQPQDALTVAVSDSEPPVNPQGYSFSWGDGTTTQSTTPNVTHTYAKSGHYTILATVTEADGATESLSTTLGTNGSDFTPYGPVRILDTRHGVGTTQGAVTSGAVIRLKVAGTGSIPTGITAVALNLTAVDGTGSGFLRAYADGVSAPSVSNVNYGATAAVANEVIAPVGADGWVDIADSGITSTTAVDVIADVTGYFSQDHSTSGYEAVPPARILDTRHGVGDPQAPLGPLDTIALQIVNADGGALPSSGITAVSLHVTAVDTTSNGFVTVFPDGTSTPAASNLNYLKGQTISNTVIVPVGANGNIDLYNGSPTGSTDLIADVTGYYTEASGSAAYVPGIPTRELDTRGYLSPVSAGASVNLPAESPGTTYVLNLTALEGTGNGFLTAAPAGGATPNVSNVNYLAGQTVSNMAQVAVTTTGSDQGITITNNETGTGYNTVEIIGDVFGYYSAT